MKPSPQIEDGYTRIANELYEAILGFGFTQRQLLVLLTVLRKTYGYGKKEDDMSAAQIGQMCNVGRNHVTEVIGQLVHMNVLTRAPGTFGLVLGINKAYSGWLKVVPKKDTPTSHKGTSPDLVLVPNQDKTSPDLGQVDSPNLGHTKENLPKETQKKARTRRAELSLADWLAACKESGEKPIPEDDSIFDYADKQRLPIDFVRYAWLEFRRKYGENGKRQRDWRAHFRNAVRENWYGLWFAKGDEYVLTTRGVQVQREHQEAA
ncbi:TPA: replication protein [Burkholderia vietnamiensis]|uniref:replication protein n=1 Tax=Burkholderia vietnamiensis TaxID=60552 RepID=UPI001BA4390D|nr:replication protein [Burkholderia vietnamiensis]MBR8007156.1 replication protein [Burkholderia vietnamiensis]HDR9068958.1 replication protein [Burkholderia vietnamiensis]HDR9164512.1 replication protein [Burkholderia vietnamiensis]